MPVHNALEYVERTLTALEDPNITQQDWFLVIVNDASNHETKSFLELFYVMRDNVQLLTNPRQQLFTRTVNRGLRWAWKHQRSEYFVIMNSDCVLKPGWDCHVQNIMEIDHSIGLVGYRDSTPEGLADIWENVEYPGYVTGHLLTVRSELLEKVGVLCETDIGGPSTTFPEFAPYLGLAHIGSDRLFSYEVQKANYKTVYCNLPGVEHEAGKSWNHDLGWLSRFNLEPLWTASDRIDSGGTEEPKAIEWLT